MRQLWQCVNCGFIHEDDKVVAFHEGHCEEYNVGDKVEIRTRRADIFRDSDKWEKATVCNLDPAEFSGKRVVSVRLEGWPPDGTYYGAYHRVNVGREIRKVKS